ncbi:MAG: hypothetical protein ACE5IQ_05465 [Candidatus Methylomirabilales bacterium]
MNKVQIVEAVIKGVGDAMGRLDTDAQRAGTNPQVFAEGLLDGLTNCLAIVATNTTFKSQEPSRKPSPEEVDAMMGRFYEGIKSATMTLMKVERERGAGNGGRGS